MEVIQYMLVFFLQKFILSIFTYECYVVVTYYVVITNLFFLTNNTRRVGDVDTQPIVTPNRLPMRNT